MFSAIKKLLLLAILITASYGWILVFLIGALGYKEASLHMIGVWVGSVVAIGILRLFR